MAKHTPGIWTVFAEKPDWPGIDAVGDDGHSFAVVVYGEPDEKDRCGIQGRTNEEAHANAALIAAGPDLLSALKRMIAPLDGFSNDELHRRARVLGGKTTADSVINARAAIAKAEGV